MFQWWRSQQREIRVAIIAGAFSVVTALGGVATAVVTHDPPSPTPGICIDVLDKVDDFIDKNPANVQVLLEKDSQGNPLVDIDPEAVQCGVTNPEVLQELARPSPSDVPENP
jgi:hypothetical protein